MKKVIYTLPPVARKLFYALRDKRALVKVLEEKIDDVTREKEALSIQLNFAESTDNVLEKTQDYVDYVNRQLEQLQNTEGEEKVAALITENIRLRNINYSLRLGESETVPGKNGVSYLAYRIRKALQTQIAAKVDENKVNIRLLHGFTTEELKILNREEGYMIESFLKGEFSAQKHVKRVGIKRALKDHKKGIELTKLLEKHPTLQDFVINKASKLTYTALRILNRQGTKFQQYVFGILKDSDYEKLNAAFIKGAYLVFSSFSRKDHFRFEDIKFEMRDGGFKSHVIFEETIYELLGEFVKDDEEGKLVPLHGVKELAKQVKTANDTSYVKGVFGELIAAYYLKNVLDMEIIGFGEKYKAVKGETNEIDIIAIDKDGILWDVEVKNASLHSVDSCRAIAAKVKKQLRGNEYRSKHLQRRLRDLSLTRPFLKGIRSRGMLVADRPMSGFMDYIPQDDEILFEQVDLIPYWLQVDSQ